VPTPARLECARCAAAYAASVLQNRCACGGTLLARYVDPVSLDDVRARPPGMWRYAERLPLTRDPVSLGEPQTPLLPLPRVSEALGVNVLVKDDGVLPGGTFKARGAAVGVSRAAELGATSIVIPTAGNAGGVWALYAARAGIPCTVTMARSAPAVNQRETVLAGARLELVDGTLADAGALARAIANETGGFLAATFNEPYRVEGKKTAWFETFDELGRLPGSIVFPVGGGVGLVAAAKAIAEVRELGWWDGPTPQLVAAQSADCAPIVAAFESGAFSADAWPGGPTTSAAGLRVTAPGESHLVLRHVRESGGVAVAIEEEAIVRTVGTVASAEGVWLSPEGAVAMAAAELLAAHLPGPVVVYNTASGAKYALG
jgi:threonine synthase